MLKEIKWSSILLSVIYIVAGVLLIVFPGVSGTVIAYILGIAAIVFGVVDLTTYFLLDIHDALFRNEFAIGILCIVFGIVIIVRQDIILAFIPIIMGMIILASGFVKMQKAVVAFRIHYPKSWLYMAMASVSIILGIVVMVFMNGSTAQNILFIVIGAGLVYSGVSDLIGTLFLANQFKKFENDFQNAMDNLNKPEPVDAEYTDKTGPTDTSSND